LKLFERILHLLQVVGVGMARESRGEKARRQIQDLNVSGLTDAQIARDLGVNRSTVGRWRKGETSPRKGGKGGKLTRLWKRTDKRLGEGGTVNLTSFYRRIWVEKGEPQLPLALETPPTYSWPPNAPVSIMATFSDWVFQYPEGDVNVRDKVLSSTFGGSDNLERGDNGEEALTDALLKAIAAAASYPLVYARMSAVLLRWGKN
jgi:transcriptional regulator with XRE-family HTH domain